ncbi:unnamed protein product, partial [Hydatigera taeniaeformis]|uniref:IMPG2 protein n=1 Tax=Hydatigena taeniaeformis TaxID=6205 RepID=A0A0R3X509_HYDTA
GEAKAVVEVEAKPEAEAEAEVVAEAEAEVEVEAEVEEVEVREEEEVLRHVAGEVEAAAPAPDGAEVVVVENVDLDVDAEGNVLDRRSILSKLDVKSSDGSEIFSDVIRNFDAEYVCSSSPSFESAVYFVPALPHSVESLSVVTSRDVPPEDSSTYLEHLPGFVPDESGFPFVSSTISPPPSVLCADKVSHSLNLSTSVLHSSPLSFESVEERPPIFSNVFSASLSNRVEDIFDAHPVESAMLVSSDMPSEICVPVSDSSRFLTSTSPPLLPVSDLLIPVSHPIGIEILETEESKATLPLHLGLTHDDLLYVEQTKPLEYATAKAKYSHPEGTGRDVHVGLIGSADERTSEVKSLPPGPLPLQAVSVETEDHLSTLPGVSTSLTSEAAVYIDKTGNEVPIGFSSTSTSESVRPLAADHNLTCAAFLAVTESEHVDSFAASQRPSSMPEAVSADKCLKRHSSVSSSRSLIGSVETPHVARFFDSSLEIRVKIPRRLFYTANTQEVVWEEVVLFDHGQESPLPFPNVSVIVPVPEPNLSAAPQRSFVQDAERELPVGENNDLIPTYASLPWPKTKDYEASSHTDGAEGAVLGASAPEICTNKADLEPSAEVMNLLSVIPISSAPVSSEVMMSEVSTAVESLSSPAIASATKSHQEPISSELDVYILSPCSSEEGKAVSGPIKDETSKSQFALSESAIPSEEKVEESNWDDLSQLAAAAGATFAAEYVSEDDEEEDEDDSYEFKSVDFKSSRPRPAPETTLDRSSQLLSRLKFYGLGTQQVAQASPRLYDVERGMSKDVEESENVEKQVAEEVTLDDEEEDEEEHPKIMVEDLDDTLPTIPEVAGLLTPEDDDSLNDDEIPMDLKLVPAHEEDEGEDTSLICSRPISEYLQQMQSLSRLSASSQRSLLTATATDGTEESSKDSQATVIQIGSDTLTNADKAQEASRTTLASLDSDLNLLDETRLSTSDSLPQLPREILDASKQGRVELSTAMSTDQVMEDKSAGSRHFADTVSTPSILERSTSSGIYCPQKGRLQGFPRKGDPGASEPVLSKSKATASQSPSLIEFERLEKQMIANSSPDSLQKTSGEQKRSSSSRTSSSLSEFERIEAEATKSFSASSGEMPSATKGIGDGSMSSLSEFLRAEQECASSQESVHQQPIDSQLAALAHKTIGTIYEDVLAEQMCQSVETSRLTDSSEIAGDADSLVQSSIHDSLASSSCQREILPIDLIRDVIRGARDVLEQRYPRDRDSLGEADSSEEDFPQVMETSTDSLEGLQQHSQHGQWGDSSLSSEANYSRNMTDSLEDSGAAMASGSRASTQPPSQSEVLFLPLLGPPPIPIQSSELPQLSIPRSTSGDEALLKKVDIDEDAALKRLPVSVSITSLNLAQEQIPISQTDSNLGSTVFDISEDEFKGPVHPGALVTESSLKSLSSSPVLSHEKDVEAIPEIPSSITPMAESFGPKDISTPTVAEPDFAVEEEIGKDFEIIRTADYDFQHEQK